MDVLLDFIKELNCHEDKKIYGLIFAKSFLDSYRKYISSLNEPKIIEIIILNALCEFTTNLIKEELKSFVELKVNQDLKEFQNTIDIECQKNQCEKLVGLYVKWKDNIVSYNTAKLSLFCSLADLFSYTFKLNKFSETLEFKDLFIIYLNLILSFLYRINKIQDLLDCFTFVKEKEKEISNSILDYIDNIDILLETNNEDLYKQKIRNNIQNFINESIDKNINTQHIFNSFSNDSLAFQLLIFNISKLFMNNNSLVNLYMSTEMTDVLGYFSSNFIRYNQVLLYNKIYRDLCTKSINSKHLEITQKNQIFHINSPDLYNKEITLNMDTWYSVIGDSGVGKSTFCKYLMKKIENDNVKFCGQSYTYFDIIHNISFVDTNKNILDDTVLNNMLLGIDYKDKEKFNKLMLSIVYLMKLFKLNVKLNTNCKLLSTGEKQKIKIIRLILLNKPIWILDEAISNIDIDTCIIINKCLRNIAKNKLVVFITHTKKLIEHTDYIIDISKLTKR